MLTNLETKVFTAVLVLAFVVVALDVLVLNS